MIAWFRGLLGRLVHLVLEDPWALATLVPRVLRALGLWVDDLIQLHLREIFVPLVEQTGKLFFRGVWGVLALAIGLGAGLQAAAGAIGSLIEPTFESAVARILARDGIPLALAVFVAARSGAAIAAKLAVMPAMRGLPRMRFRTEDIRAIVLPNLVASAISGALFYLVFLYVAVQAYHATESLSTLGAWTGEWILPSVWAERMGNGMARSVAFGFTVAYTASALGVAAAEGYRNDRPETKEVHYAVWESTVLGVLLCFGLTVAWQPVLSLLS